jgi:hypothetical protein
MPFVTFLIGLLIAGTVVVTGAALVIVWTVAYGAGRYCHQEIQRLGPHSAKVRVLRGFKRRVS